MKPAKVNTLLFLQLFSCLVHAGDAFQNVSLTVSSLKIPLDGKGKDIVERELEMNWLPSLVADWIGLFNVKPPQEATEDVEPLVRINPADNPDFYHRTNISFSHQPYPNGWNNRRNEKPVPGDACFSFWIAAYKNNKLVAVDCLKIRPTWMGDHRVELENMPLADLFLPGTHNSGSCNKGSLPSTSEMAGRYLKTQDTDVWGQLVHGIRYLDLRAGYYPGHKKTPIPAAREADRYWLDHNVINVQALVPMLEDIKAFAKKAKYEIIILDFHELPASLEGNYRHHYQLADLLQAVIGDSLLPSNKISYNPTLGDVWKTGSNIIVAYNDVKTTEVFPRLWGPVPQMWGDKQTPGGLKTFLQQCMDDAHTTNNNMLWAAMAALTPTPIDFMFGGHSSLRELADTVNHNVTIWFHNYWWKHANIVATDFFLGNNIIDVAVRACLDKANNRKFQVV